MPSIQAPSAKTCSAELTCVGSASRAAAAFLGGLPGPVHLMDTFAFEVAKRRRWYSLSLGAERRVVLGFQEAIDSLKPIRNRRSDSRLRRYRGCLFCLAIQENSDAGAIVYRHRKTLLAQFSP